MLFGLDNAPVYFQKTFLIEIDQGEDWLVVYIDDSLIVGSSYEEVW